MRKKDAPYRLTVRDPAAAVRPMAPVPSSSGTSGLGRGAVVVTATVLSAGVLMAALALPRGHAHAASPEVRASSPEVRELAENQELMAPQFPVDRFPAAPVPTTVRVVPNPHPPRLLGGAMMMPMNER